MADRPLIGVIASRYQPASGASLAGIGEPYLLAVEAAGGIPLLLHLTRDAAVRDAHYSMCDGLLFAGGGDVDPAYFGQAPHPKLGSVEPLRDEVELALARRAAAEGKPALGICRGIQLLNVALGGTLYQDIPAELPAALDHSASAKAPERAHLAHALTLAPGAWLAAELGTQELPTNSFHHQALRDIAPGLRVAGRAPDGVVEAVEGSGAGFLVGVQCHPEGLWAHADPRWARLFAGFVDAARQARDQPAAAVEVVAYDPRWPQIYAGEQADVRAALAGCLEALEHIGSTAIPGLRAKPVIDMMAAVRDLSGAHAALVELGYQLIDTDMPARLFLRKRDPQYRCRFHLHIVERDGWEQRNERLLRDYLCEHAEALQAYGELKQGLAREYAHDSEGYTRAKTAFIQSIVDQARDQRGLARVSVWEE